MMKREEIAVIVGDILVDQLMIDERPTEDKELVNDLGADSLDRLDTLIDLENAFNINASDEDAEKVVTVGDLIDLVGQKMEAENDRN